MGRLDSEQDGIDRGPRSPVRTVLQPVANGALEQLVLMPGVLLAEFPAPGLVEAGAQGAGGVVQSRTRGAVRDTEGLGHRHEGHAHVVMQDEHRALVEREPAERVLELVAIGDRLEVVGRVSPPER